MGCSYRAPKLYHPPASAATPAALSVRLTTRFSPSCAVSLEICSNAVDKRRQSQTSARRSESALGRRIPLIRGKRTGVPGAPPIIGVGLASLWLFRTSACHSVRPVHSGGRARGDGPGGPRANDANLLKSNCGSSVFERRITVSARRREPCLLSQVLLSQQRLNPDLLRLWREKRGKVEPEDLSRTSCVQPVVVIEDLNRR